jgi:hypothetical protein
MFFFSLMFLRTKPTAVLLCIPLVSVFPLSKLGTFPFLLWIIFQDLSLSSRCVTAANRICQFLDVFHKHTISLEDTLSLFNPI